MSKTARIPRERIHFNRLKAAIMALTIAAFGVFGTLYSSAATTTGTVKLTSYAVREGKPRLPIGGVEITVKSIGGSQKCSPREGATTQYSDHNIILSGCMVASDGGPKFYQITQADRAGWTYSGYEIYNEAVKIEAHPNHVNSFQIKAGVTTSLAVFMTPPADFNPPEWNPAPDPTPAPAPPPTETPLKTGKIKARTYAYKDGNVTPIGNVDVTVASVGGPQRCNNADANAQSSKKTNADNSTATFIDCQVARDDGPKQYRVVSATRPGYEFRSIRLIEGNDAKVLDKEERRFAVENGKTTTISIWMNPPENFNPDDAKPPAQEKDDDPVPNKERRGALEITTYVYKGPGSLERIGNTKIAIESVNFEKAGPENRCSEESGKTDSSGGSKEANANYGQVNFKKCWTSSDGAKYYRIKSIEIPSGYEFRSLHSMDGVFKTSKTGTAANVGDMFEIKDELKTRLGVWMNKVALPAEAVAAAQQGANPSTSSPAPDVSTGRPGGGQTGAVHQVVTPKGVEYVPAKPNQASKTLAEILNSALAANQLAPPVAPTNETGEPAPTDEPADDSPVEEGPPGLCTEDGSCPTEPATPPSLVTNFKAVQEASGSITLTWDASTNEPVDESVSYTIKRTAEGATDFTTNTTDETSFLDEEELEYPKKYKYQIFAEDELQNASAITEVDITTVPLTPNVPAEDDGKPTEITDDPMSESSPSAPQPAPEASTTDPVEGGDKTDDIDVTVKVEIPDDAHDGAMACGLSDGSVVQAEMTDDLGEIVGTQKTLSCRQLDGGLIDDFGSDIGFEFEIPEEQSEDVGLYQFDGVDWQEVQFDGDVEEGAVKGAKLEQNGKTKFKVASKNGNTFALIKQGDNGNSINPIVIIVPVVLSLAAASAIVFYKLRLNKKFAAFGHHPYTPDPASLPVQPLAPAQVVAPSSQPKATPSQAPIVPIQPPPAPTITNPQQSPTEQVEPESPAPKPHISSGVFTKEFLEEERQDLIDIEQGKPPVTEPESEPVEAAAPEPEPIPEEVVPKAKSKPKKAKKKDSTTLYIDHSTDEKESK